MSTFKQCALALILAAACSKGGPSKAAGIELFGSRPVPPGELAKVKAGMTQAAVEALFPGIKPAPNHSGSPVLGVDSGYSNVKYEIGFYADKDEVASIDVVVPPELGKQVPKAWGPPSDGGMHPTWINDDDGYEVAIWEMHHTSIKFRPFVPLTASYFGAKPGPVDVLARLKLGMTRDEIRAVVPGLEGAPKGGGSYVPFMGTPRGVELGVRYDAADDKADSFIVRLPEGGGKRVIQAWGPRPGKAKNVCTGPGCGDGSMNCWDAADGGDIELDGDRLTYNAPTAVFCDVVK